MNNAPTSQVLRDYQTEALQETHSCLEEGTQRVLLVAPTGAGKTTIAAAMIRGAVRCGNKTLFLAHRKELIDQCSTRLDGERIDHGVIKAKHWRDRPHLPVQVASIQTLVNRETGFYPDIIIIDEAHRSLANTYETIIGQNPQAVVIGLTATPIRSDGRGLGKRYGAMVECPGLAALTELGHLVPATMYSQKPPEDLKQVKKTAGDYNLEQLGVVMNKAKLVGDIVQHWRKHAESSGPEGRHRPTVAFAVTIEHSKSIVEEFRAAGIAAEHLDGETPEPEREAILRRLAAGMTKLVSNCGVLCEGWDSPGVSCVVLARPTMSLGLYLQMAGRVLRPAPGKQDCLILDHAGCFHRHGHVSMDRDWTLDESEMKKRTKKLNVADSYKVCPDCMQVAPLQTRTCGCGYQFAVKDPSKIEQVDGELELVKPVRPDLTAHEKDRRRARYYELLERVHFSLKANKQPYKPGFAGVQFKLEFRDWPLKGWKKEWEALNAGRLQHSYQNPLNVVQVEAGAPPPLFDSPVWPDEEPAGIGTARVTI